MTLSLFKHFQSFQVGSTAYIIQNVSLRFNMKSQMRFDISTALLEESATVPIDEKQITGDFGDYTQQVSFKCSPDSMHSMQCQ
jgi:hypothetical protein